MWTLKIDVHESRVKLEDHIYLDEKGGIFCRINHKPWVCLTLFLVWTEQHTQNLYTVRNFQWRT